MQDFTAREVHDHSVHIENETDNTSDEVPREPTPTPVCVISEDAIEIDADHTAEIPTEKLTKDSANIFTRATEPFKPTRVEEIQRLVTIGDDLTAQERSQVQSLISEFADVFALSVNEVTQVDGAIHRLNIDPNAKFSTKVHQKPLTPPQRRYLHEKLQAMLDADIIEPCEPGQVKCVSPTTLAQKTHEGAGLTLDELQHHVNEECARNGLEPHFELPPRVPPQTAAKDPENEKTNQSGEYVKTSCRLTRSRRSPQCCKVISAAKNSDSVATAGYQHSILQQVSTRYWLTQNHGPTWPFTLKDGGIFGTRECPLGLQVHPRRLRT